MAADLIYSRLSSDTSLTTLVSTRIYPVKPTGDVLLPIVVYTLSETESFPHLTGVTSLKKYTYTIDYYSVDQNTPVKGQDQNRTIGDTIQTRLNGWRESGVSGCFLQSRNEQLEETGYHGSQVYTLFA